MKKLNDQELIQSLLEIKMSIIENATDVLFMRASMATICEEIDGILIGFGCDSEWLLEQYDTPSKEDMKKWVASK